MDNIEKRDRRAARKTQGNVLAGILLLIVGGALLMRQLDYDMPRWLFKWPMILIVVGIFVGAVNRFRDFGWLIICGVGFFFIADDIWPEINVRNFIWPTIIIVIGLLLIFRPKRRNNTWYWQVRTNINKDEAETYPSEKDYDEEYKEKYKEYYNPDKKGNKEDVVDAAAVFGAVKKNMYSKTFKGGEIVSVFGGVEVDLSQADFEGVVKIESVNIFGGATLIVPPTWQVRSEAVAIFGGIEDKRRQIVTTTPEKVLVLEGFVMFGGIEIKSY